MCFLSVLRSRYVCWLNYLTVAIKNEAILCLRHSTCFKDFVSVRTAQAIRSNQIVIRSNSSGFPLKKLSSTQKAHTIRSKKKLSSVRAARVIRLKQYANSGKKLEVAWKRGLRSPGGFCRQEQMPSRNDLFWSPNQNGDITPRSLQEKWNEKICAAAMCNNRSEYLPDHTYHKFPSDPDHAKRRSGFKCVGNKYCCSQHFVPNDYRISLIGHRKDLKTGAMPSIFLRSSAKSHVKEERPGLLTQAKILHKEGNCQKNRHWAMKCKILLILYRSSSDRIICWSEMFRSRNPKEEF